MSVSEETLKQLGVHYKDKLALRFEKSLNGLQQAGRLWSELLDAKLVVAGFISCVSDSCQYFKRHGCEITVIGVCVDDLLVTSRAKIAWNHSSIFG